MDRRQLKTRTAIFDAFGELLSQKSYSKITVQDIIDSANVGRTTFYSHFETKDSLLEEMCLDLFQHIFSDDLNPENTHDFSSHPGDPHQMITHILYHLMDNRKNIIGILQGESSELFLRFFRQYLEDLGAAVISAQGQNPEIPRDFLVNHITGSFVVMVQWWLKNNLAQSPEELAKYFMAAVAPALNPAPGVKD